MIWSSLALLFVATFTQSGLDVNDVNKPDAHFANVVWPGACWQYLMTTRRQEETCQNMSQQVCYTIQSSDTNHTDRLLQRTLLFIQYVAFYLQYDIKEHK